MPIFVGTWYKEITYFPHMSPNTDKSYNLPRINSATEETIKNNLVDGSNRCIVQAEEIINSSGSSILTILLIIGRRLFIVF